MDETNVMNCAAKNVHERTAEEISSLKKNWDSTPAHFNILDLKTFLQDKVLEISKTNYSMKLKSPEVDIH
jgi:hypothetical protein